MTQRPGNDSLSLDNPLPAHLAALQARFRTAWELALAGGTPPRADDYLAGLGEPERSTLRRALEQVESAFQQCETIEQPPVAGTVKTSTETQEVAHRPADPAVTVDHVPGTLDYVPQVPSLSRSVADLPSLPSRVPAGAEVELPDVAGYQILGVLGRGAMGVVYKARQLGLKRIVALKMILAGGHADESDLARFRAEAELVAQLQHPNIVQIHEVGEANGCPFFSLEFVDGGSLAKKIHGEPQPARPAAHLVQLLAEAMDCAHRNGVVHRDLKPANVMLAAPPAPGSTELSHAGFAEQFYGVPKIADFGLAKRLQEESGQTRSGTILGTASYMAPEQAAGRSRQVGPLADVWALGAILYELLTGRPPFKGEALWDTLDQVRTQEPVPPTRLQPKVPRDLETICLKCLQKEPGKRYASAGELAADLHRFLAGEPIQARPVGRVERAWRWCRRNPVVASLGAAVFLSLVAGTVISIAFAIEAGHERDRAIGNEKRAITGEQLAVKNEKLARQHAQVAGEQAQLALGAFSTLVFDVQKRLKDAPELSDEMRALREGLFKTAIEGLQKVARKAETAGVTDRTMAQAHLQMGKLFRELGKHEEAEKQYESLHAITAALVKAEPDNDKNRGNLAVSHSMLGEITLERRHDARAARAHYLQALALQTGIVEQPRDGFYKDKPIDVKRMLARSHNMLGVLALRLGDPAEADKHYRTALALRQEVVKLDRKNEALALTELAGSHNALGESGWRLGDEKGMHEHYAECLKIRERLAKASKHPAFRRELASASGMFARALLCTGDAKTARDYYSRSLKSLEDLARQDSSADLRWLLASTHYGLGTVLLRLGEAGEARGHYRTALALHQELARADARDSPGRSEVMLALARCGDHLAAAAIADRLRRSEAGNPQRLLQVAFGYALCAGAVPGGEVKMRSRYVARALELLVEVTAHDYRDVIALERDPDLDPIRDDPGFRALIAALRK